MLPYTDGFEVVVAYIFVTGKRFLESCLAFLVLCFGVGICYLVSPFFLTLLLLEISHASPIPSDKNHPDGSMELLRHRERQRPDFGQDRSHIRSRTYSGRARDQGVCGVRWVGGA